MPDPTYRPKVYRKQGGDEQVIADGGVQTVESGGIVNIKTGAKLQNNGVDMDLSSGIATSTTAATAELNLIDGSIAGTSVASKALALGASKNTDILGLPVGGLKIGAAGAEVVVTPTAAELNSLAAASQAADGLGQLMVARATFNPSANAGERTQAAHSLAATLPANALVVGGFIHVNTAFTSAGGNAGEVAISVEAANDIQTSAAVSGAPWSTIGRKAIVPKANTPETTSILTTQARAITATVITQNLTAGKATIFLYYVVSAAQA